MKKILVPLSLAALVSGVLPARSHGQTQGARQTAPKKSDTVVIPPSQRLKNWSDSSTAQTLGDVVVVAYGTQKKASLTGAVAQISDSQFAKRPITNILDGLTAIGPGLQSTLSSGQPGSTSNLRVRGFGSISAGSSPLMVVDGMVYDGDPSGINPADVATMSLLMDAASTALYGSRGSNGVIVITTKKGSRGKKTAVQFKMNQGVNVRMLPEYAQVNAYEYYPLMWEYYRNGLVSSQGGYLANKYATEGIKENLGYNPFNVPDDEIVDINGKLNPNAKLLYADDLDWEKAGTRKGFRQDYTMSFNGGNENADYYASVGYITDKGYTPTADFKRWNGRVNANARLNSFIKAGVNVYGSTTNTNQTPAYGSGYIVNPFYFSRTVGPIYPVHAHDPNGAYVLDKNGQHIYDDGIHTNGNRPFSPGRNALAEGELNVNYLTGIAMGARTYVDATLAKGLKLTTNLGLDQETTESYSYLNPTIGDGSPAGSLSRGNARMKSYSFNQLLNYNKSWDGHSIEAMIGHENSSRETISSNITVRNQIAPGNKLELENYTTVTEAPTSSTVEKRIEGYLSRINYDYSNIYYLSASLRRDGNSLFAASKRWYNFGTVSGAWRISKEDFFHSSFVNDLKLKASYGSVGNDNVGTYVYQSGYMVNNNAQEPGYIYGLIANKDLTWESNRSMNIGVEFSLFKGRISGNIDVYNRITSGLIFNVPQPLSGGGTPSGAFSIWMNVGNLYNRGVELTLNTEVIKGRNFNWDFTLNAMTVKNKITSMPESIKEIISGTKKLEVGHSIYDFYLYSWKGVDPANGDALYELDDKIAYEDNAPYDDPDKTIKGVRYTTASARAKRDYQGSAIPDLQGSFRSDMRYKNFSLNLVCTYQIGGKTYDGVYASMMTPSFGNSLSKDILKRWQATGDQTDVPRMDYLKGAGFAGSSNRWLVSATSLTVNSINLGYDFNRAALQRLHLSGLQTYLSVENAYQFSARKGMNVLQTFSGTTGDVYLPRRVYSLGVIANL
ncbi:MULTISPECIES: SusC/RagA family TonB-linked outer membrane protein [Niastella]|uniref:SusC/RagA family TonB-linked outer membrane protein n=1 Tax=Niastella soli TaxID=2821487 RepID=A0ABS3Z182_9BACT|nr:SusC/RagA family TonB-linked outer membrane protein [Niastella soli]MBO9203913.1 SusC/RagA family TonB-linked outer membrane protein [Niastella soli]